MNSKASTKTREREVKPPWLFYTHDFINFVEKTLN